MLQALGHAHRAAGVLTQNASMLRVDVIMFCIRRKVRLGTKSAELLQGPMVDILHAPLAQGLLMSLLADAHHVSARQLRVHRRVQREDHWH